MSKQIKKDLQYYTLNDINTLINYFNISKDIDIDKVMDKLSIKILENSGLKSGKLSSIVYEYENNKYYQNKIIRKLSDFDNNAEDESKGLAICHGHNHSIKFLKLINSDYWYFVNIDPSSFPDYVADASNKEEMAYFPDNYFDYIVTIYCNVVNTSQGNKNQYSSILKNAHRILNKDGMLVITELPGLFFWTLDKKEFNNVTDQIDKIISKKDFENYKIELQKEWDSSDVPNEEVYQEIIVGNYEGPNMEKLGKLIEKISLIATKKYLLKNHFEFVSLDGRLLMARPIKN